MHPKCSSKDELNSLCDELSEKVDEEFNKKIELCKVNLSENKEWAKQYYSLLESNEKLKRSIKRLKVWRWVLIIFLIFPFFLLNNAAKKKQLLLDDGSKLQQEFKEKLDKQLSGLIGFISYELIYKDIIESKWKDIKLEIFQNYDSYSQWEKLINKIKPKNSYFAQLVSGQIFNNHFMVYNLKWQTWYMHVYTGSIPVSYTTSNSKGETITHTTIVTASEVLPAPKWTYQTELAYNFDRPYHLCFTNYTNKKEFKKWNKANQSPMENKDFEKLFKAIRNDEKDYRVVFTPLAQENFVKLLQQQKYNFIKNEDVSIISLEDNQSKLINSNIESGFNYDIEVWKKNVNKWVENFVYHLGLLSLPIANIPLYYQFRTKLNNSNSTLLGSKFQAEDNLHYLFNKFGLWSKFDTDVIFEPLTSTNKNINGINFCLTKVKCKYFYPNHKIIYKTAVGPKGPVSVPIKVIEYLDREKIYTIGQSTNLEKNNIKNINIPNSTFHKNQIIFVEEK